MLGIYPFDWSNETAFTYLGTLYKKNSSQKMIERKYTSKVDILVSAIQGI